MKVPSRISALFFSAITVPSSSLIASILGLSFFSSHWSLATPPINIGRVWGTSRYIPNPKDVPIPVAHSTNTPRRNPSNSSVRSPCPSAKITEKVAKAFACGAIKSILPFANSLAKKIATPAPITAPGTTPMMLPLEM